MCRHYNFLWLFLAVVVGTAKAQNTYPWPSSGNVGIGTTNPSSTVDVTSGGGTAVTVHGSYNSNLILVPSGTGAVSYFVSATGAGASQGPGKFIIGNGSQDVLGISSSNVGIGTTSPSDSLTIRKPTSGGVTISSALDSAVTLQSDGASYNFSLQNDNAVYPNTFSIAGAQSPWPRYLSIKGSNGNVGIGTTSPAYTLDVAGQIHASTGVVYPDGSQQATAWTGVLCGGDYAEAVDASGDRKHYGPGDVLVLGSGIGGDVEKSAEPYSTMVAGIFATKPGVVGRRETLSKSYQEIPMAMVGIVPTNVNTENGPIRRGDLLVTSSKAGYAMKGTDRSRMLGAVIGKAMGSLDSGGGVIEVLVTLQ